MAKSLFLFSAALMTLVLVANLQGSLKRGQVLPREKAFESLLKEGETRASEKVSIVQILALREDTALIQPENALPSSQWPLTRLRAWVQAEKDCHPLTAADEGFAKWRRWIQLKCARPLGPAPTTSFFTTGPALHPLGGSWGRHAFEQAPTSWKENVEFRKTSTQFTHILESPTNDSTPESRLAKLSPGSLRRVLDLQNWAMSETELWILVPDSKSWLILSRPALATWLSSRGLALIDYCDLAINFSDCLTDHLPSPLLTPKAQGLVLGCALVALLTALTLLARERSRRRAMDESHRKMVLQTMAHELRHPATSLQLSLEVLRDQYDELPGDAQLEFLRMLDQTQKLRRVLEASRQYLESSPEAGGFQFNRTLVEDVGQYLRALLENYEGKITLKIPPEKLALELDRYWFGLCVTNLVKNALIHGQAPIHARMALERDELVIAVFDSGPLPSLTFEEMIQPMTKSAQSPGMGLGLSLVNQLMSLMGGRLEFHRNPKRFELRLKGVR